MPLKGARWLLCVVALASAFSSSRILGKNVGYDYKSESGRGVGGSSGDN